MWFAFAAAARSRAGRPIARYMAVWRGCRPAPGRSALGHAGPGACRREVQGGRVHGVASGESFDSGDPHAVGKSGAFRKSGVGEVRRHPWAHAQGLGCTLWGQESWAGKGGPNRLPPVWHAERAWGWWDKTPHLTDAVGEVAGRGSEGSAPRGRRRVTRETACSRPSASIPWPPLTGPAAIACPATTPPVCKPACKTTAPCLRVSRPRAHPCPALPPTIDPAHAQPRPRPAQSHPRPVAGSHCPAMKGALQKSTPSLWTRGSVFQLPSAQVQAAVGGVGGGLVAPWQLTSAGDASWGGVCSRSSAARPGSHCPAPPPRPLYASPARKTTARPMPPRESAATAALTRPRGPAHAQPISPSAGRRWQPLPCLAATLIGEGSITREHAMGVALPGPHSGPEAQSANSPSHRFRPPWGVGWGGLAPRQLTLAGDAAASWGRKSCWTGLGRLWHAWD